MSARAGRRVVIDGLAARLGGTAYAAVHLARLLGRAPEVERVVVVTREGSILHRGLADADEVALAVLPDVRLAELPRRLWWEARELEGVLEEEQATDLVHLAGMLPRRVSVPVTSYLLNPVPFQRSGPGELLRRAAIVRTSRAAASVLAPTEAMATLVEPALRRRPAVVPLGIERDAFRPAAEPGDEVLVVADFYRHKRHDIVLDAWRRLREPRPALRLVGSPAPDPGWTARVRATVDALDARDQVVMEHGLPLDDLAAAYRRARVFLLPSEHESFCMPLAEALASGVPALVRGTPTLRETGGPGAIALESDDAGEWAAELQRLVDDDGHHGRLREAGLRHAERYSFQAMADGVRERLGSVAPTAAAPRRRPDLRPALLPSSLALLLVLVLVAGAVARRGQTAAPPAMSAAAPASSASYGDGLSEVVPAPVASLAASVGNRWREVAAPAGRANVVPIGPREEYFSLGFVAYARDRAARLQIQTSAGENELVNIPEPDTPRVVTLGPLRAAEGGLQGLALFPVPPAGFGGTPDLIVSPLESRWLRPGDGVLRMESLRERGPDGLRGQWIPVGVPVTVPVTPGVEGRSHIEMIAAVESGSARVLARVGSTRVRGDVTSQPRIVRLGPVEAASSLTLRFQPGRGSPARVMLEAVGLRPGSARSE